MHRIRYTSAKDRLGMDRRTFIGLTAGAGLLLGNPGAWAADQQNAHPARPHTNIADALAVPKTRWSLPGTFPGRVAEVHDPAAMKNGKADGKVVDAMFRTGLARLTRRSSAEAFRLWFEPQDIVGIKVNPVGAGLISTRLELVDAVIRWLEENGLPRSQIVIWDRFDYMLADAGFTPDRFPGVSIAGLQTMDEAAAEGKRDNSRWLTPDGHHVSEGNFDRQAFYFAEVDAPQDKAYLNQHVFNGRYSYFGKLVTRHLTKIINIPVFKNTGNGISMATKNLGYGSICNTGRLHRPLFFNVCTEVLAFPAIRDKLVLNITDALRGQYDGGPMPVARFTKEYHRLFLATDPFALDTLCHERMVAERKAHGVRVNEHPMFTDYLRYAQTLGLGVTDRERIVHVAT